MWYRANITTRKGWSAVRMIYGNTAEQAKKTLLDDFSKHDRVSIRLEQLSNKEKKNSILFN